MGRRSINVFAGIFVTVMVAAAAAVPLFGSLGRGDTVLLHGRMAESGGWTPADLRVEVGEPLHLRLTSDDVVHSFAIGQFDLEPVDVLPGKVSAVTVTFDKPGKYTFYCTRWCGPNHWRMRGVIEVSGEGAEVDQPAPPLYVELGIDIDQPHPAAVTPAAEPSAARGAELLAGSAPVPEEFNTRAYYRASSPADIWQDLRAEPALSGYSDRELWDLTAALIQAQAAPEMITVGKQLFSENCAACHGENGKGDGVFAGRLAAATMPEMDGEQGHAAAVPSDFTDPSAVLGASPALLQGKIVRGGMGTGMPYWGPVLSADQTWALVAYIQSFLIEMEDRQ